MFESVHEHPKPQKAFVRGFIAKGPVAGTVAVGAALGLCVFAVAVAAWYFGNCLLDGYYLGPIVWRSLRSGVGGFRS